MLTTALLITFVITILFVVEQILGLQMNQPLFVGPLVGLMMGDFQQGMLCGATLQLLWLGVGPIGAYVPPDVLSGTVIGTVFAITSGQDAMAGVAIAVPVAMAVQQLNVLSQTINITFAHKADKAAEEGDFDKMDKYNLLGIPVLALAEAIPIFVAIYFGTPLVQSIINSVPKFILGGLSVAGGIMPALGFAILLAMMLDKKLWSFLLIGFVCNAYGHIPTLGIAFIGVALAVLYDKFLNNNNNDNKKDDNVLVTSEGGLDL